MMRSTFRALFFLVFMGFSQSRAYQDPLQLYDPIFIVEPGFILGGGADYYTADRTWDNEDQVTSLGDLNCSESYVLLPIRIGYAPIHLWRVDMVLPLVQPSYTTQAMGSTVTSSSFGLSNPWLASSYLFGIDEENVLRPRVGVKLPFFATTEEDYIAPGEVPTGDKNINMDLTLSYAFLSSKSRFLVQVWLAGRYAFPADYEIEGVTSNKQPPLNIAGEIAPGYTWDANAAWQSYVVANLMMDLDETSVDETSIPGTQRRRLSLGVRQTWVPWAPDPANGELIFDFSYGLSGTNITTGIDVGLGYFGYIKL